MSMNLQRWRREQRAISREQREPIGDQVDLNVVMRALNQWREEYIRERYEIARLRQSGKRRKLMLRCKLCDATRRNLPPQNLREVLLRSYDDGWTHSFVLGWICGACMPSLEFRVPMGRLGGSTTCSAAGDG